MTTNTSHRSWRARLKHLASFTGTAALLGAISISGAATASADTSIVSEGPLTTITISDDLNCDVRHAQDTEPEWFNGTACGTFVAVGDELFGPRYVPAGSGATLASGYSAFTPLNQSSVSGAGTAADPLTTTTRVALGDTGIELTQTDSYVVGEESYRTDIQLVSTAGSDHDVVLYRGGDCYLQDNDYGLGRVDLGFVPVCQASSDGADPNRIELFYPLTAGSNYFEGHYSSMWAAIGSKQPLPDECNCDGDEHDNAIAISWALTLAASGAPAGASSLTSFSPIGVTPVQLTKTADDDELTIDTGETGTTGYTITATNGGAVPVTLNSLTDTLPSGFTYIDGSTTGVTTADPTVSGSDITWAGPFEVPAAVNGEAGTITLHFEVTVPATAGTFTNSVSGVGEGATVIPAIDTAPVTVIVNEVEPTPEPTPTETPEPTPTPTVTPDPTPTSEPTPEPTPTETAEPTPVPSATPGDPDTGLPTTGADPTVPLLIGGGLLVVGAVLYVLYRRKMHRE
ncbi:LPXTG cell wall anchor domain-containing protein [Microbacterium sp. YY-01]|uniref:LPXTG cell wall anchor domain-containing protein n=1 Tax=Microbacterium sp. YY-01 TaxID=3421634 RepID=UPI003D177479